MARSMWLSIIVLAVIAVGGFGCHSNSSALLWFQ